MNLDILGANSVRAAEPIMKSGNLIMFDGEIKMDEYEKDGQKRISYRVVSFEVPALVPTIKTGGGGGGYQRQSAPATTFVADDEMPF